MESDKLKAHQYAPIGGFAHPYLKKNTISPKLISNLLNPPEQDVSLYMTL
jgi:hypothetical protein